MDLSNIKMVVTDMDGTLLNSNHEISNRFYELFERLRAKNIHFVAASGRQYYSMVQKLDAIKNEVIFIAENGAFAKFRDTELHTIPIENASIQKIIEKVTAISDGHPAICTKDKAYLDGKSQSFIDMLKEYYARFDVIENVADIEEEILKVAIYHPVSSEKYIYPAVQDLESDLKIKVSGPNWVDVSHKNAHKGFALKKIMQQKNILPNEVMVFGDYNNDLEMLALADYSFAMANAHPNVKKIANYETLSNDENGVEVMLEKLL